MASGMPLFAGDSEIDQVFRIFERLGTPTPAQWSAFSRLPEYQASFPQFRPKVRGREMALHTHRIPYFNLSTAPRNVHCDGYQTVM